MQAFLDFEAPVAELEGKIAELKAMAQSDGKISIADDVKSLEKKAQKSLADLYQNLTPWQKAQVARHQERPHALDYIRTLITDFVSLSGDRKFAEDEAIVGGLGRFNGQSVVVIGQEKGSDTESRIKHNFGMAKPEGYRKAVRLMEMADRFGLPVITFVDTSGAYPGVDAEERGQAEAIARSTDCCLSLGVPLVSVIIGEGGSGGAIAIATANTVLMLEHAIYSVISPEGAASILWRDPARSKDAAVALKITAQDLKKFGVIDEIIEEPLGGAHRNADAAMQSTAGVLTRVLTSYQGLSADVIRTQRREKFLGIGRGL
ncbi:MAG: acetyl-CoA carboxylase carboxyltransferase subunit alpha [Aestuariivirga sp.]